VSLDWLLERMAQHDSAAAVIEGSAVHSYEALLAAVSRWTTAFADREMIGRVVSVEAEYGLEAIAATIGAAVGGNVLVPISMAADARRDTFLAMADVEFRVIPADARRPIVPTGRLSMDPFFHALWRAATPGLVLFSSTTPGTPKAAVHDLAKLLQKFDVRGVACRSLALLPPDHLGGVHTLFHTLSNGGTMVIPDGRAPAAVCRTISRHRVEVLPASPTFLNMLLQSDEPGRHDLSSLRLITCGTEPMPPNLLGHLHAAFPGVRLLQTDGLTGLAGATAEPMQEARP